MTPDAVEELGFMPKLMFAFVLLASPPAAGLSGNSISGWCAFLEIAFTCAALFALAVQLATMLAKLEDYYWR